MSIAPVVEFRVMGDARGQLVALEGGRNVPFDIKRVYYLTNTVAGVPRGFHAHRKLEQVAISVAGKCRMVLDDGVRQQEVWLDTPNKGVLIPKMVWREMHDFSPDCVLLVLANAWYDETDYLRNYDQFLAARSG